MANKNEPELRSDEVQEILTQVPHWMIRWGNIVILLIIFLLLLISWFVRYPDIISTQIVITTNVPPEKLVAKTSGKIEAILVADRSAVSENAPLAIIENSADFKDVFLLKQIIENIDISKNNFPFALTQTLQLGEIESAYAVFQKESMANELNLKLQPYRVESEAQNLEAVQLRERVALLQSQRAINESELVLQKNDLERYERLLQKGVISSQEFEKQKLNYLQAEKNYKSILGNISQLRSALNDLNKNSASNRINETKEGIILERNVILSFFQLKKAIKDWELNYVLRSSINGTVSFLQIWTANQTVVAGDNVFTVIPTAEDGYVGKIKAPMQNSGKIAPGQDVAIRLAKYPDNEFGILNGKVKSISLMPDDEGDLLIDVVLSNGLQTSYGKQVVFQQEMAGSADIITEDLRLIERLLYKFRSILRR